MPKILWSEEFRPKTLSECLIPDRIQSVISGHLQNQNVPHMIFYGQAGTSKTTVARCVANDLGSEVLFFNASDETKKSEILDLIVPFASSVSISGNSVPKIIIADEAERMDSKAQDSLKGFLERFSGNCRMIMTCNSFQMIIDPLKSRTECFNFNPDRTEKTELILKIFRRVLKILKKKGISEIDKEVLVQHVKNLFPDIRKIVNSVESASFAFGKIDERICSVGKNSEIADVLFPVVLQKDFNSARKLLSESLWNSHDVIDSLFANMDEKIPAEKIPQIVLILAEYSYKISFVANHQICLLAMLAEIMGEL
jgi:DNA polymerase III delta prime subunit